MYMPDIAFQKLREQRVAEAFIKEYNRKHKTDYSVNRQYNEEFPDIKFKSASNNSELAAEVVQVVESESEKATESSVVCLQTGIKAELENLGWRGIVVAILYETLPIPAKVKAWINSVASYVQSKGNDLKQGQFKFDRGNDSRSFWDMSHVKNSIRFLQIKLVANFDEVAVMILKSHGRQMFPEAYLSNAITKKSNKYSPDSIKEVILLLDCNFPAIEEADMKEFAEHAQKNNVNAGFKEIWCVNILLDRTIVQQLCD
jgi:ribosomal protein S17E